MQATIKQEIAPLLEEVKKIKALAAQTLKEGRQVAQAAPAQQQAAPTFKQLGQSGQTSGPMLTENNKYSKATATSVYADPNLSFAAGYASTASLPDIDIPVPNIFG